MSQSSQAQTDSQILPRLCFPHSFPETLVLPMDLGPNPITDPFLTPHIRLTPRLHLKCIWNPTTALLHRPHLVQAAPHPLPGNVAALWSGSRFIPVSPYSFLPVQSPEWGCHNQSQNPHLTGSKHHLVHPAPRLRLPCLPPSLAWPVPQTSSLCLDSLFSDTDGSFCTQMALSFEGLPCDFFTNSKVS